MQHPLVRPSLAPYGFAFRSRDRLEYKSKHDPFWVNAERQMAKFWERQHRLDAPGPLPIETIIHRILPGQGQANRITSGEFEFRGFPYLSRDIALLSSIMYWFGTNVGSCFLECDPVHVMWYDHMPHMPERKRRAAHHPEREFSEKYRRAMREQDMVAFWGHQCNQRCGKVFEILGAPAHFYDRRAITLRDRAVAEGLMRWLGRAEGRGFIADWLAYLKRARQQADVRRERDFKQQELASAAA